MPFCVHCGWALDTSDIFCPNCGKKTGKSSEDIPNQTGDDESCAIVELDDENGNAVKFCLLDRFLFCGNDYLILTPADDFDDGEVVILQVLKIHGIENFASIDNPQLLNRIFEEFKQRNRNRFNFI